MEQAERTQYGWRAAVLAPVGGRGFEGVLYWEDDPATIPQPGDTIKCDATAHRIDAQDELYVRARGTMLTPVSYTHLVTAADYDRFDHLVVMDARNERGLRAIIPADPAGKVRRLLPGREVADPWYTGDFEAAWSDVLTGCEALLRELDG